MNSTRRLKHVAIMRAGGTPRVDDAEQWAYNGVPWVTISDMTRTPTVTKTERCVSSLGIKTRNLPVGTSGTILFAMYASVGALGVLATRATWSQAILGIEPIPGLAESHFLSYWMEYLRPSLRAMFRSNTQDNLNADQVANFDFPNLSYENQHIIARFLDAKIARIDAVIAKKRRMVALLEERINSVIRQRIGDSGLAREFDGPTILIRRVLTKVELPATPDAEMITAFRDGQVTARSIRRTEGYTLSWIENSQLQTVRKDDVVIHGLDGFAGAIGTAEVHGVCSPVYHVCEPKVDGDPVYLGRLLRILATSGYLGLFASSTRERAVDFRNWDLFGRIPIPDVPLSEQRKVGDSIRRIGPLKRAAERSAELANEYRRALITAVVTGEMDVPGVRR